MGSDDEKTKAYLRKVNHEPTMQAVTCERAFLMALGGDCRTPFAGQAKITDDQIHFQGMVISPDGVRVFKVERTGPVAEAFAIGFDAGKEVRSQAGEAFFE